MFDNHLDDYVTRIKLSSLDLSLAILNLDSILSRNGNLKDEILHSSVLYHLLDVSLNLVLITRIRMDYVPLSGTIAT